MRTQPTSDLLLPAGKLLVFISALFLPLRSSAQDWPIINEVMADNSPHNAYALPMTNELGHYEDWVELYNPWEVPLELGGMVLFEGEPQYDGFGWYLTNQNRFMFPYSTMLQPKEYLIVWFDTDTNAGPYHTGFGLKKNKGDMVFLSADWVTILDSVGFGPQLEDLSIGRFPNGSDMWTLTIPTPGAPNRQMQLGSSAQIKINEWMPTNPICSPEGSHCYHDWFELYNPTTNPVALGGLILTTSLTNPPSRYTALSNLSFIEPGGFLQIWATKETYHDAPEVNFGISHRTGETLTLYDADGVTIIDRVTFPGEDVIPWVTTNYTTNVTCEWGTCTTNVSASYRFCSQGRYPDGSTNFMVFASPTPGEGNFLPIPNLVINEILAHTDPPLQDAVELFNSSPTETLDLSGFWLSNSRMNRMKYRIRNNTTIPPLGFKVFYEYQFNPDWTGDNPSFTFSAEGDGCYVYGNRAGTQDYYRTGVRFGVTENGVSVGPRQLSSGEVIMVPLQSLTFGTTIDASFPPTSANSNLFVQGLGASNAPPKMDVIISEVMYNTYPWGNNGYYWVYPYIELYNLGTNPVSLCDLANYDDGWGIRNATSFRFPPGTMIGPGQFLLVVPFNPVNPDYLSRFRAHYGLSSNFSNIVGGFVELDYDEGQYFPDYGQLDITSGTIELFKPINSGTAITVEKMSYLNQCLRAGIPISWTWTNGSNYCYCYSTGADGGGLSLQRTVPESCIEDPTNWVAALPTPGRHSKELKIHSVTYANQQVTLTILDVWAGRSFSVQECSDLVGPGAQASSWTTLQNVPAQAMTGPREVSIAVRPGERRFYRIISAY